MTTGTGREAFLPLFVGDFLAATAEWTGEEQALYLMALAYQWSIGSLPTEPAKLARLVRWDRKAFDRAWPQVSTKFDEHDGRLQNARLEEHRAKSHDVSRKRAAAGSAGGNSRWQKDGNRKSNGIANAMNVPIANGMPSIPSHPIPYPSLTGGGDANAVAASAAPTPPPVATPGPNRKRRGALGHFVPESFQVSEDDYLWALDQGYSSEFVRRETERFCDHEFKTPRSDWARAWRNWISKDPPKGAKNGKTYRAA